MDSSLLWFLISCFLDARYFEIYLSTCWMPFILLNPLELCLGVWLFGGSLTLLGFAFLLFFKGGPRWGFSLSLFPIIMANLPEEQDPVNLGEIPGRLLSRARPLPVSMSPDSVNSLSGPVSGLCWVLEGPADLGPCAFVSCCSVE